MAATQDVSPYLTAAHLNTIPGKEANALTIQDIKDLLDALNRVGGAYNNPTAVVSTLFV